ncbi:MAG: NADH:ubiquinone oxidoreductase subunit NDUFA12 [Beijerinckiaceae bacterium]|nr:NADH:ubiquinone oxidoreductase subunit NDUFA12 [Beijerinckiaceae bacterium]
MKTLLLQIFTWWNGQTLGTRFWTWRKGEKVGTDQFGNTYYRTRGGAKDPALGHERRWVIYNGEADASMIPPGWHGWMHHRVAVPPSQEDYTAKEWEMPHEGNPTGSAAAYRPAGSILAPGQPAGTRSEYEPWRP